MSETTIAVIKDVTGEKKNGRDGEVVLWTIQAEGGPFKSWNEEVGQAAWKLKGENAEISWEEKERTSGDRVFKNKFVNKVRAATATSTSTGDGPTITGGTSTNAGITVTANSDDERGPKMARSKATEVASRILAYPEFDGKRSTESLFKLADALAHYSQTGEHPAVTQEQPVVKDDNDIPF